jgi:pentatricopeptide repeat protein
MDTIEPSVLPLLLLPLPAESYNALLEICYKSNDSDRALDVIDRMANDEVEPDEFTYEIVSRKRTWRSYLRKQFG